jgi:hypothetical protein
LSRSAHKNIPISENQKLCASSRRSAARKRGASRSSRTLGAECDGRGNSQDERCYPRTAKSCGPDTPTLVSSCANFRAATVAKEPGHRGEHEVIVKTIAQGRPDCFGEPVVTALVCFFNSAREAMGAASTRLSLRPPFGRHASQDSGASAPREHTALTSAV